MTIFKAIILLILGFVILIKSSNYFVDAISSIAANFKMSKMMIALTVAAFGTCTPELAISFNSMANAAGDIALGNVFGSNIVNILLIVGFAACINPIKVKDTAIKKEIPILMLITLIFSISILFHLFGVTNSNVILNRQDGFLFIACFALFIFYIISVIRAKKGIFEQEKPKYGIFKSIIITIITCVLMIVSSDLVVDNAEVLATNLGISTKVITMCIVSIGTSLPEMVMTVAASRKGEFDIALGNIIGTNIFNIGVVLGLPILIYGGFQSISFNIVDIFFVFLSTCILYFFSRSGKELSRLEGGIMITLFVIYYTYIFIV